MITSNLSRNFLLSIIPLTIHERNIQRLAVEMYKVVNNLTPVYVKSVFPLSTNPYNLRNKQSYEVENIHTSRYGSETVSYLGPKTWAMVPENIKNSVSLKEFKTKIKNGNLPGVRTGSAKHILPILDSFNGNLYVHQLLTYAYHRLVYILFTY